MTGKNSISFYNNGTLLETVTGTQAAAAIIPPTSAQGSQTDYANNQFITISNILGDNAVFNSVVLSSSQNSFELDDLTWGNPFIQGGNIIYAAAGDSAAVCRGFWGLRLFWLAPWAERRCPPPGRQLIRLINLQIPRLNSHVSIPTSQCAVRGKDTLLQRARESVVGSEIFDLCEGLE